MKQVILQAAARADLALIASYLEVQSGSSLIRRRFLVAFEQSCWLLARYPRLGQKESVMSFEASGEVRRVVMRRFDKYLIFYTSTESSIQVIRVLHGARDPGIRPGDPTLHV